MTDIPHKHIVWGFYILLATVCAIALGAATLTAYVTVQNDRHPAILCAPDPVKPK